MDWRWPKQYPRDRSVIYSKGNEVPGEKGGNLLQHQPALLSQNTATAELEECHRFLIRAPLLYAKSTET